jgi:hypothetical protein
MSHNYRYSFVQLWRSRNTFHTEKDITEKDAKTNRFIFEGSRL